MFDSLPKPSLNGGLYTGEPFQKGAPWGNVPVVPDTGYMIHYNLKSANPPPGAEYQYPTGFRPGNNNPILPGVRSGPAMYGLMVNDGPCASANAAATCKCQKCALPGKYAYY